VGEKKEIEGEARDYGKKGCPEKQDKESEED
jgi:hypothetical protein